MPVLMALRFDLEEPNLRTFVLFDIQNFIKLMEWFSCTNIFIVTDGPGEIGILSVNPSGVDTMNALRTAL